MSSVYAHPPGERVGENRRQRRAICSASSPLSGQCGIEGACDSSVVAHRWTCVRPPERGKSAAGGWHLMDISGCCWWTVKRGSVGFQASVAPFWAQHEFDRGLLHFQPLPHNTMISRVVPLCRVCQHEMHSLALVICVHGTCLNGGVWRSSVEDINLKDENCSDCAAAKMPLQELYCRG